MARASGQSVAHATDRTQTAYQRSDVALSRAWQMWVPGSRKRMRNAVAHDRHRLDGPGISRRRMIRCK